MKNISKKLVNIPDDKGIVVKVAGTKGEKYVYKQMSYYRDSNGKPRNKAKTIGKYDADNQKMYPNANYFDIFKVSPTLPDVGIWDYGYSYLVLKVCRDSGLYECLQQSFGKQSMDIIVIAAYMIREGIAMDGIDDWLIRNLFKGYDKLLTSQTTSRIFAALTFENRRNFFKSWVKASLTNGCVCYDVTSVSSYSKGMISVERGYNRDGESLSQFNLGMFCDEVKKIPLYCNRYSGSLTDKTNLKCVLDNAKEVGIHKVKMVLDGGFWSEDALTSLKSTCAAFTVGMPISLTKSANILHKYGKDIAKYSNELPSHHVYCVSTETEVYGIQGKALLYFDEQNRVADMTESIERLKVELSRFKRFPKSKLSKFTPYFTIAKHEGDSGFDYEVNKDKVEEARKDKGFFLLFSTDMDASPADILDYYRAKDADEKLFAQIKVDMDGTRVRTHNEQTTDGKTFVTFIACAIRAYILRNLSKYLSENSTSLKRALSQLSNIVVIGDDGTYRFAQALTKKQKQILAAFNAEEDILSSIV